ncbi:NIMA-related kinase 4 [Haematococcus lacustris]
MARSTYDDFIIKEKIGSGSYGVVFKVIRKVDRVTYAMKEIDLAGMSRKEQEECIRETRVLSSLDSDFIIKYYDSFLERGKLYIITEYAANGNLHDYIKKQKLRLPEELIWKLFVQILLGLNHMHSKKILHRDIKTLNVFLDESMNVKLGDMGVAKILSTHTNFAKTIVGTPYYLSPELCEDKPYNEKSDVWALGVVLYECCVLRHPFDADNQGALILKILRGKYPPVSGYTPEVSDIVKRCLTQNANRRPNTYKLLLLPIVRQHAEELGLPLPDQQSLLAMAERKPTASQSAGRPPSASRAANGSVEGTPSQQARDTAAQPGDMNTPPTVGALEVMQALGPEHVASVMQDDHPYAMNSTVKAAAAEFQAGDAEAQSNDLAALLPHEEVTGSPGGSPGDGKDSESHSPEARPMTPVRTAWGARSSASPVPPAEPRAPDLAELALEEDDDGEEDDSRPNPYDDPRGYHDPNDPDEEGDDGGEEGEDDWQGDEGEEYEDDTVPEELDSQGHEEHNSTGGYQPDPMRLQHMRSAMMIQRAACLDLIGDKAFNDLYALLKSNQVDEASMTDLSRLVFKIIPYDKSEVIQMMYKLLYLESQLETGT